MINIAELGNVIVKGTSRFLQKVYMADVSVSGEFNSFGDICSTGNVNIGKDTAENAKIYLNGKQAIDGIDSWLRINDIGAFTNGTYFGSGILRTDGSIQIGQNGSCFQVTNTGIMTLNGTATFTGKTIHNGGLSTNSGVVTTLTSNAVTIQSMLNASAADVTAGNLTVNDVFKARNYELSHIQNLGGDFLVTPSFYCTEGETTVTVAAKAGNNVQLLITDSASIKSSDICGVTWYANSKIKFSGKIGNIPLASVPGTIKRTMNTTTSGTILIEVDVGSQSSSFTTNTTFSGANVSKVCIMMCEIYMNVGGTSKTRPIGIKMTSYGTNKSSYIDAWSGASDSPNVRLGLLGNTGLPNVNGYVPSGWGLFTTNGYFQGTVVSNAGKIGDFTLSNAIYSSSHNSYSSIVDGVYIGLDGFSLGENFRVDAKGNMKSASLTVAVDEVRGLISIENGKIIERMQDSESNISYVTKTAEGVEKQLLDAKGNSNTFAERIDEISRTISDISGNTSNLYQTAEGFQISIDKLQEQLGIINKSFKFTNEGLIISSSGDDTSGISLKINNDRISFVQSQNEVAYISNYKLHITSSTIVESLQLGPFSFSLRSNGSLSFNKTLF